MKKILALASSLFLLFRLASAQTPLTTAPDFSVKTLDGTIIQLYPLLDDGKVVVLDFFSVSCGPCQLYAPHFQEAFEAFGRNLGNVFFLGINYNGTNSDVMYFDSLFNLTFPSASGLDGGGNAVFHLFQLSAYPTVLVIRSDKVITNPYVWPPTTDNIIDAVLQAGGNLVGLYEHAEETAFQVYPNPMKEFSKLSFQLKQPSKVSAQIQDARGRIVKQLLQPGILPAGTHHMEFSFTELTSGIFFVTLEVNNERLFEKVVVLNR